MESEPMFTPREKSLPQAQSRIEPVTLHHPGQPAQYTTHWAINLWRCVTQDSQPNTLQTELSEPVTLHHPGQPAQYTTDWAVWTCDDASPRTASPIHYTLSCLNLWCCVTQDSQPNTLHTELSEPVMLRHPGQPAQYTTHWAVWTCDAASPRTTSPIHYRLSCLNLWCCITQDNQPNTLQTELSTCDAASPRTTSPIHYTLSCLNLWCCVTQDSQPNTLQTELSEPVTLHHPGQPAQYTTHWAVWTCDAASPRTASPIHYRLSCLNLWCCVTQDSQPNTLHTELSEPVTMHHPGQPAQYTTDWAVWTCDAASPRTASPIHYTLSCLNLWRCITQDSKPNTLHTELSTCDAASSRTASPIHYTLSCLNLWRCITQDSQPNTLHTELSEPVTLHHPGQPAQYTTHWAIPTSYWVSAGTGWPGVSIQWLAGSYSKFDLQHVKLSHQIHPSNTLACQWDVKQQWWQPWEEVWGMRQSAYGSCRVLWSHFEVKLDWTSNPNPSPDL